MKHLLAVALCGALVSACATAPDRVTATYESPMMYGSYDCAQVREEMLRVSYRVREMAGVQSKDRRRDEIAWGVGLFIAWPALLFLAEGDHKAELADLKGQYDALNEAAVQKHCMVANEVAQDRATAGAQKSAVAATTPAPPVQEVETAADAPPQTVVTQAAPKPAATDAQTKRCGMIQKDDGVQLVPCRAPRSAVQ
jgi:hypothetical protein